MRDWLRLHAELLDKLEENATIEVQRRDLEARVGDFEDELHDALPQPAESLPRQLAAAGNWSRAQHVAAERQDLPNAVAPKDRTAPAIGPRTERADRSGP